MSRVSASVAARYDAAASDGLIVRERGPYIPVPRYTPPGNGWTSWTAAGPARQDVAMENRSYRRMGGTSNTRYPVVDSPTGGAHTNYPQATTVTLRRYVTIPTMRPARQNRLAASSYVGQTYSQTTLPQGVSRA